eukprot:scaffold273379_cov22-Tisochrysis_lutea.AAC.1
MIAKCCSLDAPSALLLRNMAIIAQTRYEAAAAYVSRWCCTLFRLTHAAHAMRQQEAAGRITCWHCTSRRLKHPPPPEWLSAYLQAIKRYLPFLDGQASATVLSSLVALNARVTNSEWLQHFCRTVRNYLAPRLVLIRDRQSSSQ